MPRTAISVVSADNTNIFPTAADSTNGHTYQHSPARFLVVKTGAAAVTVTAGVAGTVDGNAIANKVVTVTATNTVLIDTSKPSYRQTDGTVAIDLSTSSGVTLGVIDRA